MAPTCKEGHPVNGNGHSAMLVVKMVDVVGGAEGGGNSGSYSWAGKHQQCQREHQPEEKGWTGPNRRRRCHRFRHRYEPSIYLYFHLLLHGGGA